MSSLKTVNLPNGVVELPSSLPHSGKSRRKPWHGVKLTPGYELDANGTYILSDTDEDAEGTQRKVRKSKIAGPIWVVAGTMAPNTNKTSPTANWGIVARWLDRDGVLHEKAISCKRLNEKNNSLAQELADEGLHVVPGKERVLDRYLADYLSKDRWRSATQIGWLDSETSELIYVLPSRSYSHGQRDNVIFQPERHSPSSSSMHAQGTLDEWRQKVCSRVSREPYFLFGIALSFAGALQKFSQVQSGGFHLSQHTSKGKTTVLQCSASVWGCGADPADAPNRAFVRSWNTTLNAIEALAASQNDCILVVDELGACDDRDFSQLVYNLFGGQGKGRLNSEANLKQQRTWRVFMLSSGEESVQEKLKRSGTVKAGLTVRFSDILVEESLILNETDPARFAEDLKEACSKFYGTAGPTFIEELICKYETGRLLETALKQLIAESLSRLLPDQYSETTRRICRRFALVEAAGKLARDLLNLPYSNDQLEEAVQFVWSRCIAIAEDITDDNRAIEKIRENIAKNPSRIVCAQSDVGDIKTSVMGYYTDETRGRLYLFTKEQLTEISGQSHQATARALKRSGFLIQKNSRHLKSRQAIKALGKNRPEVYAVDSKILGDPVNEVDDPWPSVS